MDERASAEFAHGLVAPTIRGRLRPRPIAPILRARSYLYGVVALIALALATLVVFWLLFRVGGAGEALFAIWPAYAVGALALVATRGFKRRAWWSLAAGVAVALALVAEAAVLLARVFDTAADAACKAATTNDLECGNQAFFLAVGALTMLGLALPLLVSLARGLSWFRPPAAEGVAVISTTDLVADAATVVQVATPAAGVSAGSGPAAAASAAAEPLVSVRGLKKHFPIHGGLLRRQVGTVYAVDGVDFDVFPGEVFSLVGESGCGKTTLGRTLLQLTPPTAGKVVFDGYELEDVDPDDMRPLRRRMQIIFQDPFGSLNPRMPISDIIGEGLLAQGVTDRAERDKRVEDSLEIVGLRRDYTRRYPHEFSGGQRQRIGVARALALRPDFVVCDEPVSALDVSIQSQVLNLLLDLKRDLSLTYLFISHNLSVVEYFSDRIGVMYLGKIVELATVEDLYRSARHPYSVALLSAIPEPDPRKRRRRLVLNGDVPSPAAPPAGCRFHTRCWLREKLGNPERCATEDPDLRVVDPSGHRSACHFAEQVSAEAVAAVVATQSVLETAVADA
jgi:oligopeptide/dipeptide ABC transporter ATP-binding protein